jgi:glucokinase
VKVLSGDIGGTKTKLAVFDVQAMAFKAMNEQTFPSADYTSLDNLVEEFFKTVDIDCKIACFGIAGPVHNGRCEATNLPWVVDAEKLRSHFGLGAVHLINDLEANAWGIAALKKDDFFVLNEGAATAQGNAAIISAGTGLGEAGMYWDGVAHSPFATEGGHTDFSPGNDLEYRLAEFMARRMDHVSWERLLSGPGLVNLFEFFCDYHGQSPSDWLHEQMQNADPAAAISAAAMQEHCTLCTQALDLFVHLYGVEAGNLALKIMATGGLYIGGGIAPKILQRLKGPAFMLAFTAKGRMRSLLKAIPVKIILNERTALLGSTVYAIKYA